MPEVRFQIQWPDGSQETCYSPSLVVKKHFAVGQNYPLTDFMTRARVSLNTASDRVQAKYGYPCSRALGQLQQLEQRAAQYADLANPEISVLQFIE